MADMGALDISAWPTFVIPKKNRIAPTASSSGGVPRPAAFVRNNDLSSREFTNELLPLVRDSFAFPRDFVKYSFYKCQAIDNEETLNRFLAKRKQLKAESRNDVTSYAFVDVGYLRGEDEIQAVAKEGLKVGNSFDGSLGDASKGVYLSRSADLVGPSTPTDGACGALLVCRVLKGKSQSVGAGSYDMEPSLDCDSHVAAQPAGQISSLSRRQRYDYGRLYCYEYVDFEPATYPSTVCPVAVIYWKYRQSKTTPLLVGNSSRQWTGRLTCADSVRSDVSLVSNCGTRPPCYLSRTIQLDELVPFDVCAKYDCFRELSSCSLFPLLLKQRELKSRKGCFLTYWKAEPCRSVQVDAGWKEFVGKLAKAKLVAVSVLPRGAIMVFFPQSELSSLLGIPHSEISSFTTESLHCFLLSYRTISPCRDAYDWRESESRPRLQDVLHGDYPQLLAAFQHLSYQAEAPAPSPPPPPPPPPQPLLSAFVDPRLADPRLAKNRSKTSAETPAKVERTTAEVKPSEEGTKRENAEIETSVEGPSAEKNEEADNRENENVESPTSAEAKEANADRASASSSGQKRSSRFFTAGKAIASLPLPNSEEGPFKRSRSEGESPTKVDQKNETDPPPTVEEELKNATFGSPARKEKITHLVQYLQRYGSANSEHFVEEDDDEKECEEDDAVSLEDVESPPVASDENSGEKPLFVPLPPAPPEPIAIPTGEDEEPTEKLCVTLKRKSSESPTLPPPASPPTVPLEESPNSPSNEPPADSNAVHLIPAEPLNMAADEEPAAVGASDAAADAHSPEIVVLASYGIGSGSSAFAASKAVLQEHLVSSTVPEELLGGCDVDMRVSAQQPVDGQQDSHSAPVYDERADRLQRQLRMRQLEKRRKEEEQRTNKSATDTDERSYATAVQQRDSASPTQMFIQPAPTFSFFGRRTRTPLMAGTLLRPAVVGTGPPFRPGQRMPRHPFVPHVPTSASVGWFVAANYARHRLAAYNNPSAPLQPYNLPHRPVLPMRFAEPQTVQPQQIQHQQQQQQQQPIIGTFNPMRQQSGVWAEQQQPASAVPVTNKPAAVPSSAPIFQSAALLPSALQSHTAAEICDTRGLPDLHADQGSNSLVSADSVPTTSSSSSVSSAHSLADAAAKWKTGQGDEPNPVPLFGVVVPDDSVFNRANSADVDTLLEQFVKWRTAGLIHWKMKLHSQVILCLSFTSTGLVSASLVCLAMFRKGLDPSSPPYKRISDILQALTKYRKDGVVELMPSHDCDDRRRTPKEYLACVCSQRDANDKEGVTIFLTNLSPTSAVGRVFVGQGILVMNVATLLNRYGFGGESNAAGDREGDNLLTP